MEELGRQPFLAPARIVGGNQRLPFEFTHLFDLLLSGLSVELCLLYPIDIPLLEPICDFDHEPAHRNQDKNCESRTCRTRQPWYCALYFKRPGDAKLIFVLKHGKDLVGCQARNMD